MGSNCGGNDDVAAVSVVMVNGWIQWMVMLVEAIEPLPRKK